MGKILGAKKLPLVLIIIGLLILGAAKWAWWRNIYSEPKNVFNRMLSQSLSTTSVAKHTVQNIGDQTLQQDIQHILAPRHQLNVLSELNQAGDSSTTIVTENISDTESNYVRYQSIETTQKSITGEDFNFEGILDVWGQAEASEDSQGPSQLYVQNLVVPFANLSQENKVEVLSQIHKEGVYEVDYSNLKREIVNGRPTYTYPVVIKPVPYISMLKTLSNIFGLERLAAIDPSQYTESQPIQVELTVDVWSSQLTSLSYVGADRQEHFTSYGAMTIFTKPSDDDTIQLQELQNKLQQLQ